MVPQWIIERKRDGAVLTPEEIGSFLAGFTEGRIPDYQMAALAMAILLRGFTAVETQALTDAMLRSGDVLDLSDLGRPTADKHSTGGIGDKISLVLAPLAACAGVAVPMISGRGLGLTGGTLDKLESIPGFDARLDVAAFRRVLREVGCAIVGQTDRLAPADRKLYALRDVTGTVPSVPLITASIMSKKLAEGAQCLVFDVKCGAGAFMRTLGSARELAASLTDVGRRMGRRVSALITAMDQPLGRTVGNALEVREAIEVLRGGGPADVRALSLALAGRMLVLAGIESTDAAALRRLTGLLDGGLALERFRAMVAAQGGDPCAVDDPGRLPAAACVSPVPAPRAGRVHRVDAEAIGRVALRLGAGRQRADETVDPAAGVSDVLPAGTEVAAGQPLMRLHSRDAATAGALVPEAAAAVTLGDGPAPATSLIIEDLPAHATP